MGGLWSLCENSTLLSIADRIQVNDEISGLLEDLQGAELVCS